MCSAKLCTNRATNVAKVANVNTKNLGVCVIPLCTECSKSRFPFDIKIGIPVLRKQKNLN